MGQTQDAIQRATIETHYPLAAAQFSAVELNPSRSTEASVAKLSPLPTPCSFCGRSGPQVLYSKRQLALGAEERRCQDCMEELKLKRKAEDMEKESSISQFANL